MLRGVCFGDCEALLWVLQLAIFQRRLKSVDILERFKGVIFQSGGSLCDVSGWPAAPYRRYPLTHSKFSSSSPQIRQDLPPSAVAFSSLTDFDMFP